MLGLLIKDFYVIRGTIAAQIITLLFVGTFLSLTLTADMFIVISMMTFALYASTCIGTDKNSKWEVFSRIVPVSKIKVISSKYILNIIMSIIGLIFGLLLMLAVSIFTEPLQGDSIIFYTLVSISMAALSSAINIPLSIFLDVSKHGLITLFSVIITMAVLIGSMWAVDKLGTPGEGMLVLPSILAGVGVVGYIVSWIVGSKLLCEKDL